MKKCLYLSTKLECYAGSTGNTQCMNEAFHNECDFKKKAQHKNSALKIVN